MARVITSMPISNNFTYQHHAMISAFRKPTSSNTSSSASSPTSSTSSLFHYHLAQPLQPRSTSISSNSSNGSSSKLGPIGSGRSILFPFNPSLEDELDRLFASSLIVGQSKAHKSDEIWEEFKHNGKDFEYCPDENTNCFQIPSYKKKNKKPLPTECVFCKNNGEDVKIYKKHLLKDGDGNTICPILRRYICPICGASGSKAHTIKYCPSNKGSTSQLASMNMLKSLRNSTGRRRSK